MTTQTIELLVGAFAAGAVGAFGLTPLVAKIARRFDIVDRPGGRRVHKGEVPRLGGVAVFLGLLIGSLAYAIFYGSDALVGLLSNRDLLAFLAPCVIVWGIGLVDDVRGLSPAPRVVAVALAATMLMQAGYVIDRVAIPGGGTLELGFLAFPITLLWFVGVTHAFNLIDGIDGLLGTVGMCSLLGCAAVGATAGMIGTPVLAMALAGALGGFLFWNRHPARVFMGDSGSLLVGLTTAAISIKVSRNVNDAISVHIPLALCALPICETFLTLARRHVRGVPYLVGDRSHIHHVMLNKGLGVRQTVLMLGGFSALLATVAILSRYWQSTGSLVTIAVLIGLVVVGLRWLGYVELQVVWQRLRRDVFRRQQRGIPEVLAVIHAGEIVGAARTFADLQDRLQRATTEAGLAYLAVEPTESCPLPDRVAESHNAAAQRYLSARPNRRLWLFSETNSDPTAELGDEQHYRLALPPGSGHLGHLICHRYLVGDRQVPRAADVRQYLAEPLGEVLAQLTALDAPTQSEVEEVAPAEATEPAGGTP